MTGFARARTTAVAHAGLRLGLAAAMTGCAVISPTGPEEQQATFCVTRAEGESPLCCPSPGLGCQAVEATQ
jgi:hypothetical protein